jgi:hypothetical protein
MKKRKKKELIIPVKIKKQIYDNLLKYGMNPYNAGVAAGLSHKAATALQEKEMFEVIFRNGIDDIAERNYASIYARMQRLSEKAGLRPGVKGCETLRGSGNNYVEVEDHSAQIECIKEINRMTRTTGSSSDPEEETDKTINVRIILTKNEGIRLSPDRITSTESTPTRAWTGPRERKDEY